MVVVAHVQLIKDLVVKHCYRSLDDFAHLVEGGNIRNAPVFVGDVHAPGLKEVRADTTNCHDGVVVFVLVVLFNYLEHRLQGVAVVATD